MAIQKITGTITGTAGSLSTWLSTNLQTLGWTVDFTGTNSIVVRQGINPNKTFLSRVFYFIDDNAPNTTSLAREARVYGAESATAANNTSLTGMFPTAIQRTTGLCIRKSATADSVARNIYLIGDNRRFYLFIQIGDTTTYYSMYFFGDLVSNYPNDMYPQVIIARDSENTSAASAENGSRTQASFTGMVGHYMCRDIVGINKSINFGKCVDYAKSNAAQYFGAGGLPYPDINGQPRFSVVDVGYSTTVLIPRGQLPGLLVPLHNRPFTLGDTFGIGSKTYEVMDVYISGQVCVETSDTWDN